MANEPQQFSEQHFKQSKQIPWFFNLANFQKQEEHHHKKSLFEKFLSLFGWGKKKKHHHHAHANAANEPNIVKTVLNQDVPKEPTTAPQADYGVTVNLGDEQKPVSVQSNLQSSEPGVLLSSNNANDYKFLEVRNVDGVQKEANLDTATKEKITKTIADLERKSYYQTAEEMGFEVKERDLGNGKTEYTIVDPTKDNQPITAEQMQQFKYMSNKNFNTNFNSLVQDLAKAGESLGFSLYRESLNQPQNQQTAQSTPASTPSNQPKPEIGKGKSKEQDPELTSKPTPALAEELYESPRPGF